jgi:5-(carboxyamino)imidazole ribonucleotide mutase
MDVMVIAGSKSDAKIVEAVEEVLKEKDVDYQTEYCSFHREPDRLQKIVKESDAKVFICVAGLSAALPGAVAAYTKKPVIGVPVNAKMGGLDALLSIAQMPKGVPVACVGVDNGANAAHLALRIIGRA